MTTLTMDYAQDYDRCRQAVNRALNDCFQEDCEQRELLEAMRYSLLAGGKRVRPVLVLKFASLFGETEENAMQAACGIEMLHTYSLIHDDLPCMDNDDLRRGKPTCHKKFGETIAVLTGDALQAAAFAHILSSNVPMERRGAMALTLAQAVNEQGMCGGQYLDTCRGVAPSTREELLRVHALKTGALLKAACVMGVQCAGGASEQVEAAGEFASHLGLAFQIRDDILDCISTVEELGKDIGSDQEIGKFTFATLLGLERCEELVLEHTEKAKAALRGHFADTGFMDWLADWLAIRRN